MVGRGGSEKDGCMRTSSEACVLDVVEVVLDGTPGTTAEALVGRVAFRQI